MRKVGNFATGRVKVVGPSDVASDRYDYLRLEEAEPNLGVAGSDNSILFSHQDGTRDFFALSTDLEVNANNELVIAADITQTIEDIALANTNFQDVTDVGATTTNRIGVSGIDVLNDVKAADLTLTEDGIIVFEGSANNNFETILTVVNPTEDRGVSIPDANGTIITTGNTGDYVSGLGSVIYAGAPPLTGGTSSSYVVRVGADAKILSAEDAVAGYQIVREAVDATQTANYNIPFIATDAGTAASGSTTDPRVLYSDSGAVTFNPNSNQFTVAGAIVGTALAAPLITSTVQSPDVTLRGSSNGNVRIDDSLHVHDQVVYLNDNLALWNTNSDLGIVTKYATGANTAAADIVDGNEYQILDVGTTTPWTNFGATVAETGQVFTATGNGSGDGVAILTSQQNSAFFGVDRSDLTFKYFTSGSYSPVTGYNDKAFTGTLGSAEFAGLTVASQVFPSAVGSNNQVFGVIDSTTGELGYFSAALTDTNSTYDLVGVANAAAGTLRLTESGGTNADVTVTGTGSVSVTSNTTHIIVDGTVTTDTNDFLTGLAFDTANGVLTASVQNQTDVTVDLDGRYVTAESDTLNTVTGRGNTTTNSIKIGDLNFGASANTVMDAGGTYWFQGLNSAGNNDGKAEFILGNSSYDFDNNATPTQIFRQYGYTGQAGTSGVGLQFTNTEIGRIKFEAKQQDTATGGDSTASDVLMAEIYSTYDNTTSQKVQEGKLFLRNWKSTSSAGGTVLDNTLSLADSGITVSGQAGNVFNVGYTQASSNTSTGAMTVGGGVGILGDTYIGGSLQVGGNTGNINGITFNSSGTQVYKNGASFKINGGGVQDTRNFIKWSNNHGIAIHGGSATTNGPADPNAYGIILDGGDGDVSIPSGKLIVGDATSTSDTSVIEGSGTIWIDPAPVAGDANGTVIIKGDLQVDGTTTTLNSTTLTIDDLNIVVASGAADSSAADGAGLTVDGASKSITWNHTGQYFTADSKFEADGFVVSGSTGFLKADGTVDTNTYSTSDTNTTYDLVGIANAGAGTLRLSDSANSNDDITITGTGATTVTSNATHIIINSTDTNTNSDTTYDLLSVANTATNAGILRLDPAGAGGNDDVLFVGAGGTTVSSNSTQITVTSTDTNDNTTYGIQADTNATAGATDLALVDNSNVKDLVTFEGVGNIAVNRTDANTIQINDTLTPVYQGNTALLTIVRTGTPTVSNYDDKLALRVEGTSAGTIAKFKRTVLDQSNNGAVISVELGENTGSEGDPWITFRNYGTQQGLNEIQGEIGTIQGSTGGDFPANPDGPAGLRFYAQDNFDFDIHDGNESSNDGNLSDSRQFRVMSLTEDHLVLRGGTTLKYFSTVDPQASGGVATTTNGSSGIATELAFTTPTAPNTITFPDASGTVALTSQLAGGSPNSLSSVTTLDQDHIFQTTSSSNGPAVTFGTDNTQNLQEDVTLEIFAKGNGGQQTNGVPRLNLWRNTGDGNTQSGDISGELTFQGGDVAGAGFRALYSRIRNYIDEPDYVSAGKDRRGHIAIEHVVTGAGPITNGTYTSAEFYYNKVKFPGFIEVGDTDFGTFDPSSLSANRTYTLPNASGTLALTSQIPTDTNTTYDLLGVVNASNGTLRLSDSANSNDDITITGTGATSVTSNATHIIVNSTDTNTDTNTTYDLTVPSSTTKIRLSDSSNANDDIEIAGGTNVTVTRTSATKLTISATDTNTDTNTTYDLTSVANTSNGVIRLDPSTGANDDVPVFGTGATSVTSNTTGIYISSTDTDTNTDTKVKLNTSTANQDFFPMFTDSVNAESEAWYDGAFKYNPNQNTLELDTDGKLLVTCGDVQNGIRVQNGGGSNTGRIDIGFGDGPNNPKIEYYDIGNDMNWATGAHDGPNNFYIWGQASNSLPSISGHSGGVTSLIQFEFTTAGDLNIHGGLTASTKSFLIDHPTKEGMKLRHGSLEGPENGVYVRGRLKDNGTIELPDYWTGLIDEDTITVNLTPIGKHQKLFVEDIADNKVVVGNDNLMSKAINCFYTVYAERKDVDKLTVEYEA